MEFGELLDALFKLTKQQKTDFALAMSYSPGEISKYISGKRLPPANRLDEFIQSSAEYFAQAFWEQDSKDSLRTIFPIFREFTTIEQLDSFLGHAMHIAYAESLGEDGRLQYGLIRNEMILQGVENIYNHVLITLSDAVRKKRDIHVYLSMQFFLHYLARSNTSLRDNVPGTTIHIHMMLNQSQARTMMTLEGLDTMLRRWRASSSMYRADLMIGDTPYRQPYFYLEDSYLLTVNEFLEDAPYGMRIRETGYLFKFNLSIGRYFQKSVAYSSSDMLMFDQDLQGVLLGLVEQCEAIYVFANISFIIDRGFYDRVDAPKELRDEVHGFINRLMSRPIPMLVSQQAMNIFSEQLELNVPMIGKMRLTQEEGLAYLRSFLDTDTSNLKVKVRLTDIDLVPFGLLVLREHVLIFLPPVNDRDERYIFLPREMCETLLADLKEVMEKQSISLTPKLLTDYLKALPSLQGKRYKYEYR